MNKKMSISLLLISIVFSCKYSKPLTTANETEYTTPVISETVIPVEIEEEIPRYTLTLLATGDNLFHEPIIRFYGQNGTYDFTPVYSEIKSLVENSDLAFVNQETVMAGEGYGYTGYPAFNTPQSLARTLSDTGFDIVNHANNHAMDMGMSGLYATLDLWDTIQGVTVIGARRAGERHRIITKNNITLGFLSYTYGLNGNSLPANNPGLVSLINRNTMAEEIDALRPLCDFLIVSMHWGDEYRLLEPGADQIALAQFLAQRNVDLIIGHHPHVLQRAEKLPRPDGKETLCFYSLGNFVSNQREKERILGAMMLVTFTKEEEELSISDSGLIPVICHFEQYYANTKVYPLYSYSEELLRKHLIRLMDRETDYAFFYSVISNLGTKIIMSDPFFRQ
jgi:poly-gamma-glutamate synthesis protein (capsule biosynthesis protein)